MNVVVLLKTSVGGRWSVPLAKALHDRGHGVVFALPSTDGPLPDLVRGSGMAVVAAKAPLNGAKPWHQPAAISRLRRQLADELEADVVVSHLYASAVAGRLATAGSRIPHVFMSAGPLYLENRAIRLLEKELCRLDNHVICSSGALYRAYRELGVPRQRLSLIPYTIDPAWAPPADESERAAARAELGLKEARSSRCASPSSMHRNAWCTGVMQSRATMCSLTGGSGTVGRAGVASLFLSAVASVAAATSTGPT